MTNNVSNKKIFADVVLINKNRKIMAEVTGAQVMASANLNAMFLKESK